MVTFNEDELISMMVAVHKLSQVESTRTTEWINMVIRHAKTLSTGEEFDASNTYHQEY